MTSHWSSTSAVCQSAGFSLCFSRRRFDVAGPSTWNSLPGSLRDPELSLDTFRRQIEHIALLFCEILTTKCKRIKDFSEYALYKFTSYLLTHLLKYD